MLQILVLWKVKSTYRGIFPKLLSPADGLWLWELGTAELGCGKCFSGLDKLPCGKIPTEELAHWTGWPDRLGREA